MPQIAMQDLDQNFFLTFYLIKAPIKLHVVSNLIESSCGAIWIYVLRVNIPIIPTRKSFKYPNKALRAQ